MRIATSLTLSIMSLLLFAALWTVGCPIWLERIGFSCDLAISLSYFVLSPVLSLLAVIFSGRDVVHKGLRIQAVAACCMSSAFLVWFWKNPPH